MSTLPVSGLLAEMHPAHWIASAAEQTNQRREAGARLAAEIEAATAEARRAGFEAGREAAAAELSLTHAADLTRHAEAADARLRSIAASLGQTLSASLAQARGALLDRVADLLNEPLRRAVRIDAIEALIREVRSAAADDIVPEIRAQGPADLLEVLRATLESAGYRIETVAGEGADVQVRLGTLRMETRIADWIRSIEDVQ